MYDYKLIIEDLIVWYEIEKRNLKWRETPIPYYVWVSEIMLQQTRVEAVKEYFDRFIKELPEIKDLAQAEEDKLMKLWEGLGYYSRVRNLLKAAKVVMEEYGGKLPKDEKELMKLPGIGSYTAGAISSIAYGNSVPAVDGNVLRVTKRLSASYDDISKAKVKSELEQNLKEAMIETLGEKGGESAGAFNQALMDLGATICIPNGKPLCEKCPILKYCIGFQKGIAEELPIKPPKKARRKEDKTVFILEMNDKIALHKRQEKGLLSGLWEFPNTEGKLSIERVEKLLKENKILNYEMQLLGEAKHIFSHVEWKMRGYGIVIKEAPEMSRLFPELEWVEKEEIEKTYALPSAFAVFRETLFQKKQENL
ncbi:MAG: A/G-specific adenine glycosylase [Acetivibrio sp.]